MKKLFKNRILSFIYLLLIYLGICLIPFSSWIKSEIICQILSICSRILVLVLIFLEFLHERILIDIDKPDKRSYLFLPLIICCFSNIIYSLFNNIQLIENIDFLRLSLEMLLTLISVIIEELIFRVLCYKTLDEIFITSKHKSVFAILITSLLFSLMHLINLFGNSPSIVLIQLGYTFVLGFILNIILLYTKNIIFSIAGHGLFNLFNMVLFTNMFEEVDTSLSYIIFSISIAIIAIIYTILVYYISRKKKE